MEKTPAIKESTVKDFFEVIFRRKWIIIGVVFISTVLVIFLNLREPAVFESVARMLVKRGEASGVFNSRVRVLPWEEEIGSQIEMVRSRVVLDRAYELLPLYFPEGYKTDQKIGYANVGSGVISTSNVLWVSYTCLDPVFAEASVNAIVNSYKAYYQQVRTPPEMEDFFSLELNRLNEDLEYWRNRKTVLEKEWGIIDIRVQGENLLKQIEIYRAELEKVRKDRKELDNMINSLQNFRELDIDMQAALESSFMTGISKQSAIEQYLGVLLELRLEESKLAGAYTDDHKKLKQLRKQISDIYVLLEKELSFAVTVRINRRELIRNREKDLEAMVSAIVVEKDTYPEKDVELNRVDETIERLSHSYSELKKQHMNSKISLASNPEWTVTMLSPASKASQKKTRDYVRMALGPIFSLVIALGFAFFIDNLDHSIKNISEAEETLGFQVLSSFPDMGRK